jgi:hypothetical protein
VTSALTLTADITDVFVGGLNVRAEALRVRHNVPPIAANRTGIDYKIFNSPKWRVNYLQPAVPVNCYLGVAAVKGKIGAKRIFLSTDGGQGLSKDQRNALSP